jgi:hypothetical protein
MNGRSVMITALGTLVFIHKRQRLRRHQELREYYFEQMELSRIGITLAGPQLGSAYLLSVFLIAFANPSLRYTPPLQTVA